MRTYTSQREMSAACRAASLSGTRTPSQSIVRTSGATNGTVQSTLSIHTPEKVQIAIGSATATKAAKPISGRARLRRAIMVRYVGGAGDSFTVLAFLCGDCGCMYCRGISASLRRRIFRAIHVQDGRVMPFSVRIVWLPVLPTGRPQKLT